jgi:hypothetical protein
MLVPDLKSYLMDRGIRKAALARLCQTAFDLELDVNISTLIVFRNQRRCLDNLR